MKNLARLRQLGFVAAMNIFLQGHGLSRLPRMCNIRGSCRLPALPYFGLLLFAVVDGLV